MEPLAARNIVILFESDLNAEIINLSASVSHAVHSRITLNNHNQLPHLSLYNTRFPEKNAARIAEALAVLAPTLQPFSLVLNRFITTAGYIFLDAHKGRDLTRVHEQILDALNALREGAFNEEELDLPGISADLTENLQATGMLLSRNFFHPHVTLARPDVPEDCAKALAALPASINIETVIDRIHLVETGQSGTCSKVLQSFELGS